MNAELVTLARHINWYTSPEELLKYKNIFLCQAMARGDAEDVVTLLKYFSRKELINAYEHAPPGLFSRRAWAYWGLYLLDDTNRPFPIRKTGSDHFDWRLSGKAQF